MSSLAAVALFAAAIPNAIVQQPVANMYSRPSEDADVVSQAIFGANVAVVEQKEGWAHIRTADEYLGWTPLKSLIVESHLEVIGETKDDARWLQVRLPDDRSGWVQAGDVSLAPKKMTVPEMLEFSKHFLGLPYTWGGTSSYGYDCSGFSQMLGRRRGLNMPRDAQPQADWSGVKPVDRKDLQPGDLLYFGSSDKKITHTGIYLGDGKFINATTYQTPMVRIDDLNEPHWTNLLVACRRVK
jgi:hypothetical protein